MVPAKQIGGFATIKKSHGAGELGFVRGVGVVGGGEGFAGDVTCHIRGDDIKNVMAGPSDVHGGNTGTGGGLGVDIAPEVLDAGGVVGPVRHGVFAGSNPVEAQATNGDITAAAGKGVTLELEYPF